MSVRCSRCGAVLSPETWPRLSLVDEIRHDDVRGLFERWPWAAEIVIAIRRCVCGCLFARREERAVPG